MKYIIYNIIPNTIPKFICKSYLNKNAKLKDIHDYYNAKFKYYYYVPMNNGVPVFRKKMAYWQVHNFYSQNKCIEFPEIILCGLGNCISVVNHLLNRD